MSTSILSIACPTCGHTLRYKSDLVGRIAACSGCGERVRLPKSPVVAQVTEKERYYSGGPEDINNTGKPSKRTRATLIFAAALASIAIAVLSLYYTSLFSNRDKTEADSTAKNEKDKQSLEKNRELELKKRDRQKADAKLIINRDSFHRKKEAVEAYFESYAKLLDLDDIKIDSNDRIFSTHQMLIANCKEHDDLILRNKLDKVKLSDLSQDQASDMHIKTSQRHMRISILATRGLISKRESQRTGTTFKNPIYEQSFRELASDLLVKILESIDEDKDAALALVH